MTSSCSSTDNYYLKCQFCTMHWYKYAPNIEKIYTSHIEEFHKDKTISCYKCGTFSNKDKGIIMNHLSACTGKHIMQVDN